MATVRTPGVLTRIFPKLRWHQRRDAPVVYLTFDDGPCPGITPWVLEELSKYDAKATFFVVGSQVERHPQLTRRILLEGHALGNHTYTHRNGWQTTPRDYMLELERTRRLLKRTTGEDIRIFRPPYGKFNPLAKWAIQKRYQIVMWDVLARDFDPQCSAEDCLQNVLTHTQAGSIIVLHDSAKCAVKLRELMPPLLEALKNRGFQMAAL